ncbi:MAG: ribosome-recycling factor [Patescibacteria group bacterium]|nr:ribosome-recycling factor [Patescibacteria group bacterium]
MTYAADFNREGKKTIEHLREELQGIRTGRPTANVLESITVDAYGGTMKMKMNELASISSEGPTTLGINPFDPSTVQDIEKSILKSPLGLTPKVMGNKILVVFPPLNQEQREKFLKLVGQIVEEHRISIRNHRDEIRKRIKSDFDAKLLTEDAKYRFEKEVDAVNQKLLDEIQGIREKKEAAIMEV